MIEKRILVAEDETASADLIREMLAASGYAVTLCEHGAAALEAYRERPFPVVVTDIEMPVMDGNELVTRLKKIDEDQIVIVLTVHSEPDVIIDIMRKGVYDYVIKPARSAEMLYKLERAFEAAESRRMRRTIEREKVVRLENQLEWFKWSDKIIQRDYDRVDRTLFASLHMSFNQGAGFGALLTLISLISSSAKREGDTYSIDANLFNLINENAKMAERALNVFSDINNIICNELKREAVSLADLYAFIQLVIRERGEAAAIKGHTIRLSEMKSWSGSDTVLIDSGNLYKAIAELLVNALKFSEPRSDIFVILDYHRTESVTISIINRPGANERGIEGIPAEYENLVFEPFFRLVSSTYEQYNTLDYGLGLTLVEKILKRHDGSVTVSNIMDHTDITRDPVVKVNFTIALPIAR